MEALSMSLRTVSGHTVLTVRGELDLHTAPQLRERLIELCTHASHVVIDLNDVDFLDSTTLGLMVGAAQRLHAEGGTLQLVCAKPRILKVFHITGLDRVFPIHASPADAVTHRTDRPSEPDQHASNDETEP